MQDVFLTMRSNKVFIALLFILTVACKKEDGNPANSGESNDVHLTLVDDQLYQLGTGIIEADKKIESFNGKIKFAGKEIEALQVSDNQIAFIVEEDAAAGANQILVSVNNESPKELGAMITALPSITNPDVVVSDFKTSIDELNEVSNAFYDSLCLHFNLSKDPAVVASNQELNDSLNLYISEFNSASPEDKMIAAKIINAQLLDLKDLVKSMKEDIFLMSITLGQGKKPSVCENAKWNTSKFWECTFQLSIKNIEKLLLECGVNTMIGSATGGILGALLGSGIGATLGAKLGFAVATTFNIVAIYSCLNANRINFEEAMVVTEQKMSGKAELRFTNDEYSGVNYSLVRRNLQVDDAENGLGVIKDYLQAFAKFSAMIQTNLSDRIKGIPQIKSLQTRTSELEDLNYLSFEVKGNNKVNFIDKQGTGSTPELMFTTDETSDQNFTLVVHYNDGVFNVTQEFDAVLSLTPNPEKWFYGTYELLGNPDYPSDCSNNKQGSKGQLYFLAYEKQNGDPGVITYFKSIFGDIPSSYSNEGNFNLNDGIKESAYLYKDLWFVQIAELEYSNGTLKTATGSANTSSYIKHDHSAGSPNGCGGTGFVYWYGAKIDAYESATAPSGLTPTEIQSMRALQE